MRTADAKPVIYPKLSPLGNNSGPTPTMVSLPGSPVIDKGSNSVIPAGITTDQRGFSRIAGASVDIGATENGTAAIIGLVFNDRYRCSSVPDRWLTFFIPLN